MQCTCSCLRQERGLPMQGYRCSLLQPAQSKQGRSSGEEAELLRAAPGSGRPIYAWYYWLQQQTCQRGTRTPAHAEHLARGARAPASAAIRVERRLQAQAAERLPQGRCLFKPDGPMPPSQTWAVRPQQEPSPRPPTSAYAAAAAAAWPHALPAHGQDGGDPPPGLGAPLPAC